ncbi:MAG: sensor histidine kinase, partial [Myxococcota bacterium]
RLRRQNLALLTLATRDLASADLETALRALTEADAHALAVERVGIWWLEPGTLRCLDLFSTRTGEHVSGATLAVADYPVYFAALDAERALCADDARGDPRLRELVDAYLDVHGITSMMDAPVRVGGKVVALVCHEHVGAQRRWTADEQQFAASIADLVALAVEARERRRAEEALRTSRARTEAVVEASLDAMVVVRPDGTIVEFNSAAEKMFRRSREGTVGTDLHDLVADPDRPRLREVLRACVERGPNVVLDDRLELRVRCPDGEFPAELRAFVFPDEGQPLVAAFVRDLSSPRGTGAVLRSEYARLEQLIAEREAPLRAALLEMESYGFTLAHELRGPVRALDAFTQLLAEQYTQVLDENGQRYLARIRSAALRMGDLVRDITLLSRVSALDLQREKVDLSEIVRGIAAELREQDPARSVTFDIEPTTEAWCDRGLARILLENLVRNAWKFTARKETAHIGFHAERNGEEVVFRVQDDGAGFDPHGADRLFEPFQRLHGPRQFEGTGIGLAVVRRIVDRHGGRVWAHGEVDRGATFCFTLPGGPT